MAITFQPAVGMGMDALPQVRCHVEAVLKGLISIEPGACDRGGYTQEQIETLARIPILVMFGDYLSEFDGFWQEAFDNCNAFIEQVNVAGGNATMLWTPGLGIFGNSHMLMMDENNLEVADLILNWLEENALGGKEKR